MLAFDHDPGGQRRAGVRCRGHDLSQPLLGNGGVLVLAQHILQFNPRLDTRDLPQRVVDAVLTGIGGPALRGASSGGA